MRCVLSLCLLVGANSSQALDRFQVEGYLLDNGLQVLLKPGDDRNHVAIRLVVGVGFDDFSCADQELPHLLEHLLFSGVDGGGEGDLEERMQALGGDWNAFTSATDTTFVIEAPARNERKVLDLLLAVLTKTQLDEKALTISRNIVEREAGGHYSHLQRWLDKQDVGHPASDQLAVEMGTKCTERSSVQDMTLEQVEAVRKSWYAPNNMTLIMVGGLDKVLPAYLERTFGELKASEPTEHPDIPVTLHTPDQERTLTSGWVGDGAKMHWFYQEPSLEGEQDVALDLLQSYMEWAIYKELRLKHSLSYGPWSQREAFGDTGMLSLNADLDRKDVDQARTIVVQLVQRLQKDGLDPATFARLKQAAIARQGWAVQGNSALADYYWSALTDYSDGHFSDPARQLSKVTLKQTDDAMRKLFAQAPYIRIEEPLLSYDELYELGVSLLVLLGLGALGWGFWRRHH
ncbi:MAG: pitrilysin family protein [Pseudomonas sp.]|uniref:M16 family metallopeptidase n=1 Tax=Pseudomonas abieticivorans TaxID=2931382 RepID=UPI0020BE966B|nr:pitrilysin family protein [Pseudomonas sp. PIA16]MDE1167549.1 pitrilysin family protein [Pseudomonas sp.]